MGRLWNRLLRVALRCGSGQQQSIASILLGKWRRTSSGTATVGALGPLSAAVLRSMAVAAANKIESDSAAKTALTVIAETKAFLDVSVVVECPNGEEIVTIARLDTGANTDVVAPKLAQVLKMNKVPWSTKGGAFV